MAGRPEESVEGEGPLAAFAKELRALRAAAGLTYEQIAARSHYGKTTVHDAARGRVLPSLQVTLGFVRACGGDETAWSTRWRQVRDAIRPAPRADSAARAAARPVTPETRPAPRRRAWRAAAGQRRGWIAAAAIVIGTVAWLPALGRMGTAPPARVGPGGILGVGADRETVPVGHRGNAAGGVALWVDPTSPERSMVIAADKEGVVEVYDLAGRRLQRVSGGKPQSVDVRGQIVGVADDANPTDGALRFYRVEPRTRRLTPIGAIQAPGIVEHGLCLYRPPTGRLYAFAIDAGGLIQQWEVRIGRDGLTGRLVRAFDAGEHTEHCAADDRGARLFVALERSGIWQYGAEPDAGSGRASIDTTSPGGHLSADVEGLTLAGSHLYASSQGDGSFAVYDSRSGGFLRKFAVVSGPADGCQRSGAIAATATQLGPAFPEGLFVCQDDENTAPGPAGNQNYKLVRRDRL